MAQAFQCTLVTPEQQVFDEPVLYASIPAWDGQIGLMNDRAPLLVKLADGALRLEVAPQVFRWFFVGSGFAQMKDNRLTLLTSEAIRSEDISVEEAQAALREAEAYTPHDDAGFARKQRDRDRARALIDVAGRT